jgi:hypothetical protein
LGDSLPPGAESTILACVDGLWDGSGVQEIELTRIRLRGGESSSVRELNYRNELLFIEVGTVVLFDPAYGGDETLTAGSGWIFGLFGDSGEFLSPISYGLRNDASATTSILRLSWTINAVATSGGPILDFPVVSSGTAEELFFIESELGAGERVVIAHRSLDPGVDLGYFSQQGTMVAVIESGALSVEHQSPSRLEGDLVYELEPTEEAVDRLEPVELNAGETVIVPYHLPHREWNARDEPVDYLVVAMLAADAPLMDDLSVVEIHSSRCPAGYDGEEIFDDCHERGRDRSEFILSDESGNTSQRDAWSFDEDGGGTAVARFLDVQPGETIIAEIGTPDDAMAYVYCSSGGGQTIHFSELIRADLRVEIDVPPAAFVICDWYLIPDG